MNLLRSISSLLHRLGDRQARHDDRDVAAGLERALLPNSRLQAMKAILKQSEENVAKAKETA